jgi:alpha-N-acetylglucosamine transferase
MIPKIIHWCWFSKDIPEKIHSYVETWKKFMPSCEIIRWNADNFDIHSVKWVEQAVQAEKWAFAADYIRLWAVYNYGGIYLDSDVEVLKPFDDLFNLPYFIGLEHKINNLKLIEPAVFGAEKGCFWVKALVSYYDKNVFFTKDNIYDLTDLPTICTHILQKKYGLQIINNPENFSAHSKEIKVFPFDYFSPRKPDNVCNSEPAISKNTYAIHWFKNSWMEDRYSIYPKINLPKNLNKKIYIWGAGLDGEFALKRCMENNYQIEGFLDSNPKEKFNGYKVFAPSVNEISNSFIIVSTRDYCHEIYRHLKSHGLIEGKDFWTPIPGKLIDY